MFIRDLLGHVDTFSFLWLKLLLLWGTCTSL